MALGLFVLQLGGSVRASVPALVASSGIFGKVVLSTLLVMSVYCWAVIWNRWRLFARVEQADRRFLTSFRSLKPGADFRLVCEQHPASLLSRVALAGQRSLDQFSAAPDVSMSERHELAHRAMDRSAQEESAEIGRAHV